MQKITLDKKEYEVIDVLEKITLADSFVARPNKIGSGKGEAKLYIGNEGSVIRDFFGHNGFHLECIMIKNDLIKFLDDLKYEYFSPSQKYIRSDAETLKKLWVARKENDNNLPEVLWFSINEQEQITPPRIYVKSEHEFYELIRELPLPNYCYLSVIKLKPLGSVSANYIYYLKLFTEYEQGLIHNSEIEIVEKEIIIQNPNENIIQRTTRVRLGQSEYREKVLIECPQCPITLVNDDRLLTASHIKPFARCSAEEQFDPKNGFMFTPTYDRLFDRGFITFLNDKRMLVSPWLSNRTRTQLNLIHLKQINELPVDGRQKYLDYHRSTLFKGDIKDY